VRAELYIPEWLDAPDVDLSKVNEVLEGSWAEAATNYAAEWTAQRSVGKRGPVGIQKFLNSVIDRRFQKAGWNAYASTYSSNQLWFRVTFRHQMSAGSNFLEGLKAVGRYDFRVAVIAAATRDFLEIISPADAPALTSFEKVKAELNDLKGLITTPILVAALHPSSVPRARTMDAVQHPDRRR